MKSNLLVIFFTLAFTGNLFAQNPLIKLWDYRYGGIDGETFTSYQQTSDGGFILGGYSMSGISGDKTQPTWDTTSNGGDYWIVKINSAGIKQWDKRFGGYELDYLNSLQQTKDKGFILGGNSNSPISGDKTQPSWGASDYWIVKTDSSGNKQWDKRYGGTTGDVLYSLEQTSDEGYILGGVSLSDSGGDKTQQCRGGWDFWIVKIDSTGNKLWDKTFGGNIHDYLFSLHQSNDGGYILGGTTSSDSGGDVSQITRGYYDFWIIKTDSLGNKLWDKRFGGTGTDRPNSIIQTPDGGYIAAGISLSDSSGDKSQPRWNPTDINNPDWWIVKIDSLGNKQWDKDFGGTDYDDEFGNVIQTYDGGYLFSGTSYSPISGNKTENNLGTEQGWMVKTDAQGNIQWDKTVFDLGHDEIGFAIQTTDSCYLFANFTNSGIGGYKTQPAWGGNGDYWIVKFCDTTLTTFINQISNSQSSILVYPNPTNTTLNLVSNNKEYIVITNLVGEIVLQKTFEGKVQLDVSFLSAGIYFIKAGNEVRKFVKE